MSDQSDEYDPRKDSHDSYLVALEAKRQRGDKVWPAAGNQRPEAIELTGEQIACLKEAPFAGFPIGSNMWPLVHLAPSDDHVCDGEDCDLLLRRGLLVAVPLAATIQSDRGDGADNPDIDLTHELQLTDAGNAVLKSLQTTSKESPA